MHAKMPLAAQLQCSLEHLGRWEKNTDSSGRENEKKIWYLTEFTVPSNEEYFGARSVPTRITNSSCVQVTTDFARIICVAL